MTDTNEFELPEGIPGDLPEDPKPKAKAKSKAKVNAEAKGGANAKEERVTIIIDEVEGAPNYEFVGVNGVGYQIQRGVETSVPISVLYALQDARAFRVVERKGPGGEIIRDRKSFQLVPFQVIRD